MIDKTVPVPRDALAWFVGEMERKLRENDDKPGWLDDSLRALHRRLGRESEELREILDRPSYLKLPDGRGNHGAVAPYEAEDLVNIIRESADIANFAAMIADNARRELESRLEDEA